MDSTDQLTANEISSLSKLPRTNKLVQQKQKSLETYNQEMPLDELLLFYRQHCKREVTAEAFEELSKSIVKQVIPRLWQESQSVDSSSEIILHRQMLQAIMENFPHQTLANADVIVFPESSDLRIVVSEPATDFFRDTAWHWRWIGEYIESLSADQQARHKEIDTYAAEELSEFLSVLGVAVVELAAIELESESDRVDADSIRKVFDRIDNYQPVAIVPHQTDIAFSEETKRQVLASLPDPMFRNIINNPSIRKLSSGSTSGRSCSLGNSQTDLIARSSIPMPRKQFIYASKLAAFLSALVKSREATTCDSSWCNDIHCRRSALSGIACRRFYGVPVGEYLDRQKKQSLTMRQNSKRPH